MANEYTASIENFVSTVLVNHPRLGKVRMNADAYQPDRDGPIIEGATQPPIASGVSDPPLKQPQLDEQGRRIADKASPLHRA